MLFVLAITTISVVYLGFEIRRGGLRIGPRPA
ncbi:MAG: hypothetical protein QOJ07_3244, partial [Thermoleophilaceae bacterium]|nr:hypothetical protein [Thermoleophilaceae bacterium]